MGNQILTKTKQIWQLKLQKTGCYGQFENLRWQLAIMSEFAYAVHGIRYQKSNSEENISNLVILSIIE